MTHETACPKTGNSEYPCCCTIITNSRTDGYWDGRQAAAEAVARFIEDWAFEQRAGRVINISHALIEAARGSMYP